MTTRMRSSGDQGQLWCHRKLYQMGSGIMATRQQQSSKVWEHFKKTKEKSAHAGAISCMFYIQFTYDPISRLIEKIIGD